MKRSYSFRCRTQCTKSRELLDILVIFFARGSLDMSVLDDELQDALKTKEPLPDVVVLLSFGRHAEIIAETWKANVKAAEGLIQRGRTTQVDYLKELGVWRFVDGGFEKFYRYEGSRAEYELDLRHIVKAGLAQLVEERGAFQEAPPGHVFRHPSKRETKQFLIAIELLWDEVDAYFVAIAVCAAAWPRLKDVRRLHIDTMGIYPVARAIEDIASNSLLYDEIDLEINSFHSHNGMNGLHELVGHSEAVLVSASTSGTMVAKLASDGVAEDALITILDMTTVGRKGTVVYARSQDGPKSSPTSARSSYETVIELTGEYFSAQGKKPRAFTLTKANKPAALDTVLNAFSSSVVCRLNAERHNDSGVRDLISLDESLVADESGFHKWLAEEVRMKTPVSVTHVLPLDGLGAVKMAKLCARHLEECTGKAPIVLEAHAVADLKVGKVGGVLVCTPLIGNGHSLRAIARDLRELVPCASRHFITGVGLPETLQAWTRLSQFLMQSGNPSRPYLFSCWQVLPTGIDRGAGAAWDRAIGLMQRTEQMQPQPLLSWTLEIIAASLTMVGNAIDSSRNSFLPTTMGEELRLTDGFIFWNPTEQQKRDQADHAAVSFVAMTSALQHAREHGESSLRLASSIHETVVLDVENFLRFNDGVLQASILRGAYPHELDYSGSPELSEMMREFLEKVFLNHDKGYGKAAAEFALALATNHLRITVDDSELLMKHIASSFTTSSVILGLLYCWRMG
jgi:hypothetical protein